MLEKLADLLRTAADRLKNRPGKHLPGRGGNKALSGEVLPKPDGTPIQASSEPPDALTMFLYITLSNDDGVYVKLTVDRDYMSRPDYVETILSRTRRYFRIHHGLDVTGCRLLTYDQYVSGVASCPDPTPEELTI